MLAKKMVFCRANPELTFEQYGLFIEDTWSILPNLNLTLGGRFDDHSAFGDFFTHAHI